MTGTCHVEVVHSLNAARCRCSLHVLRKLFRAPPTQVLLFSLLLLMGTEQSGVVVIQTPEGHYAIRPICSRHSSYDGAQEALVTVSTFGAMSWMLLASSLCTASVMLPDW